MRDEACKVKRRPQDRQEGQVRHECMLVVIIEKKIDKKPTPLISVDPAKDRIGTTATSIDTEDESIWILLS